MTALAPSSCGLGRTEKEELTVQVFGVDLALHRRFVFCCSLIVMDTKYELFSSLADDFDSFFL